MQVPSNMLITRIKPGVYMSVWMGIWAVVSACTALVQGFGGLVACRFFLGITEVSYDDISTTKRGLMMRNCRLRCVKHAILSKHWDSD